MSDPLDPQSPGDNAAPATNTPSTTEPGSDAAHTTDAPVSNPPEPVTGEPTAPSAEALALSVAHAAVAAATGLPSTVPAAADTPVAAFHADVTGACAELDKIETVALYWGGERGVEIRNHVCKARLLLTGYSHNPALEG